jgi:hypothetical protein
LMCSNSRNLFQYFSLAVLNSHNIFMRRQLRVNVLTRFWLPLCPDYKSN